MTKEEILAQIKVLKTELNELEGLANKAEAFGFKFPVGNTYTVTFNEIESHSSGLIPSLLEHGVYRLTEHGAQLSLRRNRRANRLEMLVEHLGGLKEFDVKKDNWCVYYSPGCREWFCDVISRIYDPEKVYMTEEVAKKVVDMLNSREYEL